MNAIRNLRHAANQVSPFGGAATLPDVIVANGPALQNDTFEPDRPLAGVSVSNLSAESDTRRAALFIVGRKEPGCGG